MSRGPVKIVKYNPNWETNYRQYAMLIVKQLEDHVDKIAHIGSTSIEGLGAKPIIDISVTVKDIDAPEIIPGMEELGFEYIDKYEEELPFRRYFILKKGHEHLVHVHVVPIDHSFFLNHVLFRDYLRKHKDIRDEYHLLKTRLANKYKDDRPGYQQAKTAFIEQYTDMAREELSEEE